MKHKKNISNKLLDESFTYRKKEVHTIISNFPSAKNWLPYLRMKNGKRVFFKLFLSKYNIIDSPTSRHQKRYTKKDILGRMKLVPQFMEFFRHATLVDHDVYEDRWILKWLWIKAIIVRSKKTKKWKARYELLSFFPDKSTYKK